MEEAQKFGLTDTSNQWLFFLFKNSTSKHGTLPIMKFVNEGGNIAVAINSTVSSGECLVCIRHCPTLKILKPREYSILVTRQKRQSEPS